MHIHILGICGTFMGGVAALAREAGHRVTGCDAGVYPPMSDQLRSLGIDLIEGFGADQMQLRPDVYVIGNVVSRARLANGSVKFPLMEAILDSGAPYTSGPQWLADAVLHAPGQARPRNHVANDVHIRAQLHLVDVKALDQLDAQAAQLFAHRGVNTGVAAGDAVTGLTGQRSDPTHESATNSQDMNVHGPRF